MSSTNQDDTWKLVAQGDWLKGQSFTLKRFNVLGRDKGCDITIPGTHLSRRHAELAIQGDKLLIKDLESANGTYINEERVTEASVMPGDVLRFDVLEFRVDGPPAKTPAQLKVKPAGQQSTGVSDSNQPTFKKVTSPGNRHHTTIEPATNKAARSAWYSILVVVAIAAVAGIGVLVSQL